MSSISLSAYRSLCLLAGLPLCLSACMLGPDYVKPPEVAQDALAQPQLHRADRAIISEATPPQRWWDALHDPQLSWLIDQALANSPDLQAVEAKVRASRGLVAQRRAERLPSVGATAAYARVTAPDSVANAVRSSGESVAAQAEASGDATQAALIRQQLQDVDFDQDLYSAGFDASWELDLFGRRRRALENARAQAEADAAQLADAQVQLAAEVGQVYARYRGTQARLRIARDSLAMVEKMLALTEQRREHGAATQIQVERVKTQLRQEQANIPQFEAQLQQAQDQLALMTGREPGALDQRLAPVEPLPQLPEVVPVGDPAALIQRRPDVRQAERELAASSAKIGEALSGYFPQVTLLGSVGMVATSPSDLGSDAVTTLAAPILRWSVFDFGRVKSRVEQARAGNEAYAARYRSTVLKALQDANGALAKFGAARRLVVIAGETEASASRSADLVRQRYDAGASSLIDALDVQRQQLSAKDSQAQAQVQLLASYMGLQKSLGLGWQLPASGDSATH